MRPSGQATLKQVADLAGVSLSTASVVFSGTRPVTDATRDKVLAAAADGVVRPEPAGQLAAPRPHGRGRGGAVRAAAVRLPRPVLGRRARRPRRRARRLGVLDAAAPPPAGRRPRPRARRVHRRPDVRRGPRRRGDRRLRPGRRPGRHAPARARRPDGRPRWGAGRAARARARRRPHRHRRARPAPARPRARAGRGDRLPARARRRRGAGERRAAAGARVTEARERALGVRDVLGPVPVLEVDANSHAAGEQAARTLLNVEPGRASDRPAGRERRARRRGARRGRLARPRRPRRPQRHRLRRRLHPVGAGPTSPPWSSPAPRRAGWPAR